MVTVCGMHSDFTLEERERNDCTAVSSPTSYTTIIRTLRVYFHVLFQNFLAPYRVT